MPGSFGLLAELFQKDVRTINEHLQNIFEEVEADPGATIRKFRIVQTERNRTASRQIARVVEHYSLPAIIAVGYRVRSAQSTRFRRWATARLDEYLVKGVTTTTEGEIREHVRAELSARSDATRFFKKDL